MTVFAKLFRKFINSIYGFNLEELDPAYDHPLYYYTEVPNYEPTYMTDGAVGFDLIADLGKRPELIIHPGDKYIIPTGLYIELPKYCEGRVASRSGLSSDWELILLNGVGELDYDYRGMAHVPTKNISNEIRVIKNGDRIAQLIVCRIIKVKPIRLPVKSMLSETQRGEKGFNSTKLR